MKLQQTTPQEDHLTILHFLLFFLTAILIILIWNLMGIQEPYTTTQISIQQEVSDIVPIQYSIPFEKIPLPPTYRSIEQKLSLSTTTDNNEYSYSITRYLEILPELTADITIQDFTEELRFPTQIEFSEITLKAHRGSLFPNDDLQIGTNGSGAQETRNTSINVILINLNKMAIIEPMPLYTLSFTSTEKIKEIIISNILFKVDTYTLEVASTPIVFTK